MTSGSKNRLLGLTKELAADWAATKDHWNDAKSQEFEKRFIDDLMAGVTAAMTNMDTLERALNKVRDDCE
jgi:cytochrome c556